MLLQIRELLSSFPFKPGISHPGWIPAFNWAKKQVKIIHTIRIAFISHDPVLSTLHISLFETNLLYKKKQNTLLQQTGKCWIYGFSFIYGQPYFYIHVK